MAKAPRYEGLERETPADAAARTILRALAGAVLAEAGAVLRGDDTRAVHDMRVAIRRLRSGLITFRHEMTPKRARAIGDGLRRIARKLGHVRDADVAIATLRGALGGASEAERPGLSFALDRLIADRRRALAAFAVEFSQFDRDALQAAFADA